LPKKKQRKFVIILQNNTQYRSGQALDALAAAGATALDEQRPELGSVRILAGIHCGVVCGSVVGAHGGRKQ
jgi:hypothetical protein